MDKKSQLINKFSTLTIFSVAMGFMETAVVVYLRKIYYPNGFEFPMVKIDPNIALTEILREAATIIMLAGIGIIAGRTKPEKFAFFLFSFAIWDLFYYLFLRLLLGWPSSLLTWDILFLIPVPWLGPVLAPCILSATMLALSLFIIYYNEKGINAALNKGERLGFVTGSVIVVLAFVWDFFNSAGYQGFAQFVPRNFNWYSFLLGELVLLFILYTYVKRLKQMS